MATNPFKQTPTEYDSSSSDSVLKQRSTCSCSNISIMHLFHEMKQKYPTVPDNVVSELVTQNCHNRLVCVNKLEEAVLGTPATSQTYPSHSISTSLKRRILERKGNKLESASSSNGSSSTGSSRESSVDKSRVAGGTANSNELSLQTPVNNSYGRLGLHHHQSPASESPASATTAIEGRIPLTNRPRTLPVQSTPGFSQLVSQPIPPARPIRIAPQPPVTSTTVTASPELGETVNVQLNVTVSPVANRSPIGGRHTSTLQLQPEPPYSRELAHASSSFNSSPVSASGSGTNCRSSTSVNLTLRQPTDSPQPPINIHASPLKYTSENFDAQSGIQSKLEITFGDGFGAISARRTQLPGFKPQRTGIGAESPGSNPSPSAAPLRLPAATGHSGELVRSLQSVSLESDGPSLVQRYMDPEEEAAVIVSQQLDRRQRLSEMVDSYRQQLESIQREIYVLQQPLTTADADLLNLEVQQLEAEVDRMQKVVDTCNYSASVSQGSPVISITDGLGALSVEGSPILPVGALVNRPPRPPRPPPPRVPASMSPQQAITPSVLSAAGNIGTSGVPGGAVSSSTNIISYTSDSRLPTAPDAGRVSAGEPWTCSLCTFQNHELMTTCEICSLPKVSGTLPASAATGSSSSSNSSSSTSNNYTSTSNIDRDEQPPPSYQCLQQSRYQAAAPTTEAGARC